MIRRQDFDFKLKTPACCHLHTNQTNEFEMIAEATEDNNHRERQVVITRGCSQRLPFCDVV